MNLLQRAAAKAASSMINPEMVTEMLAGFISQVKAAQEANGTHYVLMAEVGPDDRPRISIWDRKPGQPMEFVNLVPIEDMGSTIKMLQNGTINI